MPPPPPLPLPPTHPLEARPGARPLCAPSAHWSLRTTSLREAARGASSRTSSEHWLASSAT
eukprot:1141074-Prymnesium_polylepis.1